MGARGFSRVPVPKYPRYGDSRPDCSPAISIRISRKRLGRSPEGSPGAHTPTEDTSYQPHRPQQRQP